MSFLKRQFKRHFQKCLKLPFIMIWSNFSHWLLYSVLGELSCRNPKGVVADNQVYFSLKLHTPCGLAPCCIHSGGQDEGTPPIYVLLWQKKKRVMALEVSDRKQLVLLLFHWPKQVIGPSWTSAKWKIQPFHKEGKDNLPQRVLDQWRHCYGNDHNYLGLFSTVTPYNGNRNRGSNIIIGPIRL